MKISFVAPFRIPFCIPSYRLQADIEGWKTIVAQARDKLKTVDANSLLPDMSLGNYGRGQDSSTIYVSGDPGWFFRDYFLARSRFEIDRLQITELGAQNAVPADIVWRNGRGQWWLIDNTLAMLVFELETEQSSALMRFATDDADRYTAFKDDLACALLAEGSETRQVLDSMAAWCVDNLIRPFVQRDPEFAHDQSYLVPEKAGADSGAYRGSTLFTEVHPVYEQHYHALWIHGAYSFSTAEFSELDQHESIRLCKFLSRDQVERLRSRENTFGWGCTSRLVDEISGAERPEQWLDALCVMQYYYCCFDIADTILPELIAKARVDAQHSRHKIVVGRAREARVSLTSIVSDYEDLRARTASEAHVALEQYHDQWRMQSLVENTTKKLSTLDWLISTSSDAIAKKSEATIQLILFLITLLSVIGLITGLHDYLVGDYEARLMDPLHQVALGIGKSDIVIYSFIILAAGFVWYFLRHLRAK